MNVPYLCGGIFFWILTQYRNSEVTKTQLLSKLLNISKMTKKDLSQDKNFKFYTSRFKNCSDDIFKKSTIIFSDGKNYFSNDFIKNKGLDILDDTKLFTKKYINESCYTKLAQILLDLIVSDESISDDDEFYITRDFWPIKKKELKYLKEIFMEIFIETLILGVWQYIVINRDDKNLNGKDTYNQWGKGKKNTSKEINYTPVHEFKIRVYSCNAQEPKYESYDIENDSDKKLLDEFLTDLRPIQRRIRGMHKSSNLSPQMFMDISLFLMKWKNGGKYRKFISDSLMKDAAELLSYLTEFNNVFREQPFGKTDYRQNLLDALNNIFDSGYFMSDDAIFYPF